MSNDVRLRNVEEPDLEVFFEQQLDPEAARLANFPSRDRQRFMTHWTTKVLGDPTVFVQTVTVDGEPAGNVVAWWDQDRRFVGYWFGRPYWGRGIGTRAVTMFSWRGRRSAPSTPIPSPGTPARCGCCRNAATSGPARSSTAYTSTSCSSCARRVPRRGSRLLGLRLPSSSGAFALGGATDCLAGVDVEEVEP
jgi:hypothetical protein